MALEQELQTYEQHKGSLLADEGKFALVHERDLGGIFDTYEDAIRTGYDKYGLSPFMVKRIEAIEQVQQFTRDIDPCRT